ncbi:AAA domain-containing protein [Caproiciproducens sp. R1]|uniref:AAA domain-containing protein n=1 Tax=Caproiciproducens sp. R1 TaxID=3435000 RepID=UPI004033740B
MDIFSKLVMMRGKDYTDKVTSIEPQHPYVKITLSNGKKYTPRYENTYIADLYKEVDISNKIILHDAILLLDVIHLLDFGKLYRVIFNTGKSKIYPRESIVVEDDLQKKHRELWEYWCDIAQHVKIGETDGEKGATFVARAFTSISCVHPESSLAQYMNGTYKQMELDDTPLIFPFDFNQSQQDAIIQALCNSFSIIEGPPGTGKTQTIINLISNLVGQRNLNVAMVSGTNEAVRNVQEKLSQEGYHFLLADLGRKDKQEAFFANPPHPDLEILAGQDVNLPQDEISELSKLFLMERKKAQLEQQLANYQLEYEYFSRYRQSQDYNEMESLSISKLPAEKIVQFLAETQLNVLQNKKTSLFYRLKLFIKYRFKEFSLLSKNEIELVLEVQNYYYVAKISEISRQIEELKSQLLRSNFDGRRKAYQEASREILNDNLAKRYAKVEDMTFTKESFKKEFDRFLTHYPVVLSTTFSIINSIPKGFLFDYLIIDESSQVDILSGVLALSCCKHVVIVGDTKQLPQIVDEKIKDKLITQCPNPSYDYFCHSLLSSVIEALGEKASRKLLREHYRCEPAIIQFCNQRYYGGELIVLKKGTEQTPLVLCQTAPGNHMRTVTRGDGKGNFNQRELDTIMEEILTDPDRLDTSKIGFTTPYVKQAQKADSLFSKELECDTIHKYQGRQKEIMILSTVLSNTRYGHIGLRFVDDPHKINVAVSRAQRQFVLVTDKTHFERSAKELKALIGYIEYQLLYAAIVESKVVSIFDLLYREYSHTLLEFGKRLPAISRYQSENIMFQLLSDILKESNYKDYSFAFQVLLKNLFHDSQLLTEKELEYINHRASVDFVVYNDATRMPVFVIEVDGFASHENNPRQQERDLMKEHIFKAYGLPLLRLSTNGSREEQKIRQMLEQILAN